MLLLVSLLCLSALGTHLISMHGAMASVLSLHPSTHCSLLHRLSVAFCAGLAVALPLPMQGNAAPVLGTGISDTNPLQAGEDASYEATGRAELLALQDELAAAAGQGRGAGLHALSAAGAAWRKKVAMGWAPQLRQLLQTEGIG